VDLAEVEALVLVPLPFTMPELLEQQVKVLLEVILLE
jgi:hypothetical protein